MKVDGIAISIPELIVFGILKLRVALVQPGKIALSR